MLTIQDDDNALVYEKLKKMIGRNENSSSKLRNTTLAIQLAHRQYQKSEKRQLQTIKIKSIEIHFELQLFSNSILM